MVSSSTPLSICYGPFGLSGRSAAFFGAQSPFPQRQEGRHAPSNDSGLGTKERGLAKIEEDFANILKGVQPAKELFDLG